MGKTVTTTAVLKINGKEIQNTWSALYKETKKLEKELKKLPHESEEFIKKSKELDNVKKHFKEVDDSIKSTNISLEEGSEFFAKFFAGLKTGNFSLVQEGLKGITKNMKGLAKASLAFILSPWGLVIAALSGIVLATKKWVEFNNQVYEANKNVKSLTNQTGEAVDAIRVRSEILKDFFKIEINDSISSAKALVAGFGLSYDEAFQLIQDSAIKGKHKNEEFFQSIKEYPTQFQNAGFSAKEFINIINAGYDLSIYQDKLPDAIKEFTLSVNEQTKGVKEALINAFGKEFTDKLFNDIKTGAITPKKALQSIALEADRIGLNSQQAQQLTADLFRGAGEDAGGALKIFKAVNVALNEQTKPLTESQKLLEEQVKLNEELNEIYTQLFASGNEGLNNWIAKAKIFATKSLINILKTGVNVYNWFVDLNNESRVFSGLITGIGVSVTTNFSIISEVLSLLFNQLKSAGTLIEGVFTLDFGKIKQAYKQGFNNIGETLNNLKNRVVNNGKKIFKALKGEAKKERITLKDLVADDNTDLSSLHKGSNKGGDGDETKKGKPDKTYEKTIKKTAELNKKLIELEHKIQGEKLKIKEDSLEKELQLINLEYDKKISAIKLRNEELQNKILETNKVISSYQKNKAKTKDPKKRAEYNKIIKALHELNTKRVDMRKANNEILIQLENTKYFKIAALREKWFIKDLKSQLAKINKEKELEVDRINTISTYEEAVQKLKNDYGIKDLSTVRNITEAKNKLREEANKKALDQQIKFLEVQSTLLEEELKGATGPAAEQLKKNLQFLEEKLTKIRGVLQGKSDDDELAKEQEQQQALEQTDILGFSAAQWLETFDNLDTTEGKLQAVGMAMQALANAGRMFSEYQRANNEKELRDFTKHQESRKKTLEKKLDSGLITQEKYQKEVEKMEVEAANKKAELEYKQAKANKVANLFEAIGSTAVAVATALKAPWPMNLILSALVGGLGAAQIGLIASQPLPPKASYASGGFTKGLGFKDETGHEVAGAVHANEYVIPEWLLAQPKVANVAKWLEAKRTNKNESFAEGGSASATDIETFNGQSPDTNSYSNDTNIMLLYAVNRLNDVLENIEDNGIEAFLLSDEKNGKLMHEAIKKFNTIQDKNKRS